MCALTLLINAHRPETCVAHVMCAGKAISLACAVCWVSKVSTRRAKMASGYRMMMCCDLEVPNAWAGVYGQTLSELKLVITRSKQGNADARMKVDTARRVLRDKQIILALLSKAMVPWYGERLKLAGKSLQRVHEW